VTPDLLLDENQRVSQAKIQSMKGVTVPGTVAGLYEAHRRFGKLKWAQVIQPTVDLALGALTWVTGLDASAPIFAVARIAGWGAHYAEELNERPVRFRGVATPR